MLCSFRAKAPDLFSEISKLLEMKEMAKIGGTLDQSSWGEMYYYLIERLLKKPDIVLSVKRYKMEKV